MQLKRLKSLAIYTPVIHVIRICSRIVDATVDATVCHRGTGVVGYVDAVAVVVRVMRSLPLTEQTPRSTHGAV